MNRLLLALLLTALIVSSSAFAAGTSVDGIKCELSVFQADSALSGKPALLYRDTAEFLQGVRTTGFLLAFSVEIEFTRLDTASLEYSVHVATTGPNINNYSRQFQGLIGLPARMEQISGKAGASYTFSLKPFKKVKIDTAGCGYVHYRPEDFKFDPSANQDIYFVRQTHGDYYWNNIKYLLEDRYDTFQKLTRFTLPGKYYTYLCPCPIKSVIWDKRFHTMIDPTRSSIFTIYTTSYNTADPVDLLKAAVYRNYGYAPAFLVDGLAGYLSFPTYSMKEIVKQNKNLPLDSLLGTFYYFKADSRVAELTASSFVKFLIDEYKYDRFQTLYKRADDLNLRDATQAVYGKPVVQLEKDWLHYLDTLTFHRHQFVDAALQSETLFNYPLMLKYRIEQLNLSVTRADSAATLPELARACFFSGDYAGAARWQQLAVAVDTPKTSNLVALAAYRMMSGQVDSALAVLERARLADTASSVIRFNQGYYYLITGDTKKAQDILSEVVTKMSGAEASAESRVLLGNILRKSTLSADQYKARDYYTQAIKMFEPTMSGSLISSTSFLWAGIAFLGQGDTGAAQDHLSMALYLETRPFYQAMDHLWLGKVADVRGERDVAQQEYRKVLSMPAAGYQIDEAKALLTQPYK